MSNIGTLMRFQYGKVGMLKFSHDGKYLAHTMVLNTTVQSQEDFYGIVEVFHFDNETGEVFDRILTDSDYSVPYGCEFSPDNSKLYVSDTKIGDNPPPMLHQYNLNLSDPFELVQNKYTWNRDTIQEDIGALQLASDGKIYLSYVNAFKPDTAMHVINHPNEPGESCDFKYNGFTLTGSIGFLGLPSFPGRVFRYEYPEIDGPKQIDICSDSIGIYYSFGRCIEEDYQWILLGKNKLLDSTSDTVQISFCERGIDTLLLTRTTACGVYTDSLLINVDDCSFECNLQFDWIDIDTLICAGESPNLHFSSNASHIEVNGQLLAKYESRVEIFNPINDSCLVFMIKDEYGCDSTFQVCISVGEPLDIEYEDVIIICKGLPAEIIYSTDADIVELWDLQNDTILFLGPDGLFTDTITEQSEYLLRLARISGNCDSYFPIEVIIDTSIFVENLDTNICKGDTILLNDSLLHSEGLYSFDFFTTRGCDSIANVYVTYYSLPNPDTIYEIICVSEEIDTTAIPKYTNNGCLYYDYIIDVVEEIDTNLILETVCTLKDTLTETSFHSNSIGCDSIVITKYVFKIDSLNNISSLDTSVCRESILSFQNINISEEGEHILWLESVNGCDSILNLTLTYLTEPFGDTIINYTCLDSEIDTTYIDRVSEEGCLYQDVSIISHVPLSINYFEEIVCEGNDFSDTLNLKNTQGCDSIVITNYLYEDIEILFYVETKFQEDEIIDTYIEDPIEGIIYTWVFDGDTLCIDCTKVIFEASKYGILEVFSVSTNDCFQSVETFITVEPITKLYLPNVFSPNNDNVNDTFFPIGSLKSGQKIKLFIIYDRWGNTVFKRANIETNDIQAGWNGQYKNKHVSTGVYVYSLILINEKNENEFIFGDILLVR
ncbi:MAG: gliding motility-associated-like protein [Halioglobus sp.]|jgi:gliding motility-associated-like protein